MYVHYFVYACSKYCHVLSDFINIDNCFIYYAKCFKQSK